MPKKAFYTNGSDYSDLAQASQTKKGRYAGKASAHATKIHEHVATLRRVADDLPADYEAHASKIRTMADHMLKSHGQPRLKEAHKGPDRKGKPID